MGLVCDFQELLTSQVIKECFARRGCADALMPLELVSTQLHMTRCYSLVAGTGSREPIKIAGCTATSRCRSLRLVLCLRGRGFFSTEPQELKSFVSCMRVMVRMLWEYGYLGCHRKIERQRDHRFWKAHPHGPTSKPQAYKPRPGMPKTLVIW